MPDPYCDPHTGVLLNLLKLNDAAALAEAEAKIAAVREVELLSFTIPGQYDLDHLRAFHAHLFRDVYPWAGQVRTVDIGKGGMRFCAAPYIASEAERVFALVRDHGHLVGYSDADQVAQAIATMLGEVNALHPFREGNGRTQRSFFRQMAAAAGWALDWSGLDEDENISASRAAMLEDYEPLAALVRSRLTPVR